MNGGKTRSWILAIAGTLLCAAVLPDGAISAEETDLSGDWAIDLDHSDEPADVLEAVTRRKSRGLGGIRAGVSIFGIPVGDVIEVPRGDSGRDEQQDTARRELDALPRYLSYTVDALNIVQAPDTLRVVYDDLGTSIYRIGETMDVGDTTLTADRREAGYVIKRESADGPQVVEELRLDPRDPSRLYWTVAIELSSGKNLEIDRVFDRTTQP